MSGCAFLTGGTGFVGGHLAEQLVHDGWRLRALARPGSATERLERLGATCVPGSLGDLGSLRRGMEGVDLVFHLAAATVAPDEASYFEANAAGTTRIVQAILESGAPPRRMVYLSSYAACGPSVGGRPRRVDETPAPITAYGRSKLAGEAPVRDLAGSGVEAVILRAPPVYGPGDRAFLPYFRLVKRGLAPRPTGPERRVHMLYVDDLTRALRNAADAPPGTYAVAEPVEHRWSAVVAAISAAVGRKPVRIPLPPAFVRFAGAAAERVGDLIGGAGVFNREKAEEMLAEGWLCDLTGSELLLPLSETTSLSTGVARTAQWYRFHGWL